MIAFALKSVLTHGPHPDIVDFTFYSLVQIFESLTSPELPTHDTTLVYICESYCWRKKMATEIDPAYLASLPPSYFLEDVSTPLLHVSIAMAILQTLFIVLFFTSRILNKMANGIEFWLFMPAAYTFCMAHCVNGIRRLPHVFSSKIP